MSTEHREEQEKSGKSTKWIWDYFSIRDDTINMSICDICAVNHIHGLHSDDLSDMTRHLSFNHTDIYRIVINRKMIHWESHFERVQCSTHGIKVNLKCKYCTKYNVTLRVGAGKTMESHLKERHNITKDEWTYIQDWRNMNTQDYYKIQKSRELIKRTRACKKCRPSYQFRCSNLCIMLKHLIQFHRDDFTDLSSDKQLPMEKLPKKLIQLFYPVNVATGRILKPSSTGDCVIRPSQ